MWTLETSSSSFPALAVVNFLKMMLLVSFCRSLYRVKEFLIWSTENQLSIRAGSTPTSIWYSHLLLCVPVVLSLQRDLRLPLEFVFIRRNRVSTPSNRRNLVNWVGRLNHNYDWKMCLIVLYNFSFHIDALLSKAKIRARVSQVL